LDISNPIIQNKYFFDLQGKKVKHSRATVYFFDDGNQKKMIFEYWITFVQVLLISVSLFVSLRSEK